MDALMIFTNVISDFCSFIFSFLFVSLFLFSSLYVFLFIIISVVFFC